LSVQAISWVLESAPGLKSHLVGTLIGLANHADNRGRGAYPSQATLARYSRKIPRNVRKDLAQLEEAGLIRRGDQRMVSHLSADERPVVWDLALERNSPIGAVADDLSNLESSCLVRSQTTGGSHTTARSHSANGTVADDRGGPVADDLQTVPLTVNNQTSLSPTDVVDREMSSKPSKRSASQGTRLPDDFMITPEMKAWAQTNVPQLAGAGETDKFTDYWRSIPGAKGRKTDWVATWRNWMRKAAESQAQIPGQRPASTAPVRLARDEMCPKHWGQDREHCRECRADRLAGDVDGDL
jgi:hypothetical protein